MRHRARAAQPEHRFGCRTMSATIRAHILYCSRSAGAASVLRSRRGFTSNVRTTRRRLHIGQLSLSTTEPGLTPVRVVDEYFFGASSLRGGVMNVAIVDDVCIPRLARVYGLALVAFFVLGAANALAQKMADCNNAHADERRAA